jgi:site-specific DNA-cytosine methylase
VNLIEVAPFDERNITSKANRTRVEYGAPANTLHKLGQAIAIRTAQTGSNGWGVNTNGIAYTLDGSQQAVVGAITSRVGQAPGAPEVDAGTYQVTESGIRRLTPRECERLQGLPDDWSRYRADGREISDSARYAMLGDAVAVPVVQWIAQRITTAPAAGPHMPQRTATPRRGAEGHRGQG